MGTVVKQKYHKPRTALFLRTDMSKSRALKLKPPFQEVTKASSKAPILKSWYQIKDMDVVFLLIPDTLWVVVGQLVRAL